MVFLHFPTHYTDEEIMLKAKYAKLRKKKKALERLKDPKPELEKFSPLKRQMDPIDAKEKAKKLIQSGKVNIIGKLAVEKTTFKRPRTLERKILSTGRSEGHGGLTPGYNANYGLNESVQFEPFASVSEPASDNQSKAEYSPTAAAGGFAARKPSSAAAGFSSSPNKIGSSPVKKKLKVMSPRNEERERGESMASKGSSQLNKPKRGPTIYIQAQNITVEILDQHFKKFGKIINLKLNTQSVGFITFEKMEMAESAIQEMNGRTVDDISYDVQFARRQPNVAQFNDASVSAHWGALSTSQSLKSNFQDTRDPLVYD